MFYLKFDKAVILEPEGVLGIPVEAVGPFASIQAAEAWCEEKCAMLDNRNAGAATIEFMAAP